MSAIALRRFGEEIASIVGKKVSVETSEGRVYHGLLVGVDEKLDTILDGVTGAAEGAFRLVLNGSFVKEIRLAEKPFELRVLADRLARFFPGLVKLREDIGAIIVMDKIKVTEQGVMEGTGLAAERARSVYEEFVKEVRK